MLQNTALSNHREVVVAEVRYGRTLTSESAGLRMRTANSARSNDLLRLRDHRTRRLTDTN